jgi:Tfp pilus assembly protein PilF
LHELTQAVQVYQTALAVQPDFADARNNLRQTRLDRGDLPATQEAIAHAVARGGAHLLRDLDLQTQIARASQK